MALAALSGPLPEQYAPNVDTTHTVLERMGFRVHRSPLVQVDRNRWWSAAAPTEIADQLNTLLRDPDVRAIIAVDGGQTVFGYLDLIDLDAVRADPKPILGYSDLSLLHLALHARTGLVGFHADMAVPGFGHHWQNAPAADQARLETLYRHLLTSTEPFGPLPAFSTWECWRPGTAEGPLIGAVVNRIALVQATSFALPLDRFNDAILFWEEIGGHTSHVWSYLQVLRHAGILDRISGMIIGVPRDIAGLEPGTSPTLPELVFDVLGDRDIPVLANVDIGHAGPNLPMPLGIRAALDATSRTLTLLEPAVQTVP
ncbi:LD-carboxypeptidase [Actinoplanes sichuanensis]|nr:LD-carboxypeptidase [Actinoplanes sichuanensis]